MPALEDSRRGVSRGELERELRYLRTRLARIESLLTPAVRDLSEAKAYRGAGIAYQLWSDPENYGREYALSVDHNGGSPQIRFTEV